MSLLPHDDKERKMLPVLRMITGYFPKALREVTRVCVANNVRYNPDKKPADINWARGKSTDQLGSLFRHIVEYSVDGMVFEETSPEVIAACGPSFGRVYVLAEAAWRALAALELCIEEQECKVPFKPMTVEQQVAESITKTEQQYGPLTGAQRDYAVAAATSYFSREAGAGNVGVGIPEAIDSTTEPKKRRARGCCASYTDELHLVSCVRNQL